MDPLWFGLTREEAEARCESRGLDYRISVTRDPKAAGPAETPQDEAPVLRVIRAKEEGGAATLLFGMFAPAKKER